jgi:hypothetical protein
MFSPFFENISSRIALSLDPRLSGISRRGFVVASSLALFRSPAATPVGCPGSMGGGCSRCNGSGVEQGCWGVYGDCPGDSNCWDEGSFGGVDCGQCCDMECYDEGPCMCCDSEM